MKKIVVLSGAGISAESGISTFRDNGGLWDNYDPMEGSKLYWCGKEFLVLSFDSIEEGDEVLIDSDCILTGGYYYKNLYGKLTVNGDLYVSSGYLYINGGELNVAGGLYIANPGFDFECFEEYDNGFIGDHKEREGTVWENKKYEYSFGVLQLHNGLIHVGGDFIWASNYSNSFLDSGVLEVAGDYLVDKYRYGGGIYGYSAKLTPSSLVLVISRFSKS